MAAQAINHVAGGIGEQTTSTIVVGASEKVAVRLSRFDENCEAWLKVVGNSVTSYEALYQNNTIFDAIPENHVVSVVTKKLEEGGGVEGVVESYT